MAHRLEFIDLPESSPTVINDSKSTTVAASVAAVRTVLEFFPNQKVRLMIGGLSKAGSWRPLIDLLVAHPTRFTPIACFGRDAGLLHSHCTAAGVPAEQCSGMVATTEQVLSQANPGEVVLLTPGCASFDEFSDFEHRGDVFKSTVSNLYSPGIRSDEKHCHVATKSR